MGILIYHNFGIFEEQNSKNNKFYYCNLYNPTTARIANIRLIIILNEDK